MKEQIELRQEYARLVRAGKLKEAQAIIRKMQNRSDDIIEEIREKVIVEKIITPEKKKFKSLSDLTKIKGIGKKTVEDISIMFKDIKALKKGLKNNRVALRDDIVDKLKEELI